MSGSLRVQGMTRGFFYLDQCENMSTAQLSWNCLHADVSYFLYCTRKKDVVPFPHAIKEIGDVCTQAILEVIQSRKELLTTGSRFSSSKRNYRKVPDLKLIEASNI